MQTAALYVILGALSIDASERCASLQGHGLRPYNAFASPGYPGNYPANQDCVRVVQSRPGYDIKVIFKDYFQIETSYDVGKNVNDVTSDCPNDFVEFRDGRYGFSPLIGRFCGMQLPVADVIARTGFLWIRFRSDEQLEYRGFLATIDMVRSHERHIYAPHDCHIEQTHGLDGHIDTQKLVGSIPTNSSAPIDCVWQVAVPAEYQIVFYIREFQLHSPNQCAQNFIEVYSGGTSDQPLRRFCGLSASTVFSSHHIMHIRFFLADARWLGQTSIGGMYSAFARYKNCSSHGLFSCGDENCVPRQLQCNGRNNCQYGKDEANCHVAQDTLVRIVSSSYAPLVFLIVGVSIVVGGLFVWSCRNNTFCRRRRTSYSEYLRDITREPPPGVGRPNPPPAIQNGNGHARK